MNCQHDDATMMSRRRMLNLCSNGFGMLAFAGLNAAESKANAPSNVRAPKADFPAKAKNIIFCYMSGGVSHVDSFDPKPLLQTKAGQPMPMPVARTQFNNNGTIFPSPWKFKNYGQSGIPVSDIFANIGSCADDIAVIRSMTSKFSEHAQGNYYFHTGFPFMGHPSAGAWFGYGLGTENKNLPGFVVLQSGNATTPHGGLGVFSNGYLPGKFQASIFKADTQEALRNIKPHESVDLQKSRLNFIKGMDDQYMKATGRDEQIDSAIRNYETAFRMQSAVPQACDISDESKATRELYGVDHSDQQKAAYARQCLTARRLVERGVRFVELSCLTRNIGAGNAANPWDQHGELEKGHGAMAAQVDQPIAAMIKDLKSRGLLEETLVIWAGEFGRTPFSQGSNGRDHNPAGYSVWMAGGGVKGGTIYGATDEYGYHATENITTPYDLWATALHLMGLDHEALTYRFGGRDFRLTDVHGRVLKDIIA